MHFQPLRIEDLVATQRMAAELFPWEDEHQLALPAAARPLEHETFRAEHGLESVRCWTAHEGDSPAIGFALLYAYAAQPADVWLAWFGFLPEARGRGAGTRLLEWMIAHAQTEGRQTLRLWTTDEPEYATAAQLYQRRGFVAEEVAPLPGDEWRTLVFSLSLDSRPVLPWAAANAQGKLCGRQPWLRPAA